MSLFRKIDLLLARLGNAGAMQRTHVDTYTENIIAKVDGLKVAGSINLGVWVKFQELAGYTFMEAILLTRNEIKATKGVRLLILKNNETVLKLNSDTQEIESDFSNVSNRYITTISYIVSDEEMGLIKKQNYNQIQIELKKKILAFKNTQNDN